MRFEKPIETLRREDVMQMTSAELLEVASQWHRTHERHRKENALLYYQPASPDCLRVHFSRARTTFVGGGNGSAKTETCLVEMLIHMTGIVPLSLRDIGIEWDQKLRGPIQCRIGLESITTTMHNVVLPKLRWYHWTGIDEPGGPRGHWGWIPKSCLIDGDWEKSWSEKYRTLRVLYRDPGNPDVVVGESSLQITSHDQSPEKMASGDLHFYHLDEPPPYGVWTEAQVRTARVNGRVMLSMTWPDDPAINVDWIFDEIYEPGQPGPNRDPNIELFRLRSTENAMIDQQALMDAYHAWDDQKLAVRVEGQPIRFSNRVHPLFADTPDHFCFQCGVQRMVMEDGRCAKCSSRRVLEYSHVSEFEFQRGWPVVWVLDPHPRKPHMSIYVAMDPSDHCWQVAELECQGGPGDLKRDTEDLERELGLSVRLRLIDPRMAASPSGAVRGRTWLDEFAEVGLVCDPADPADVGRERFNELLRPHEDYGRPGVTIHPRCPNTILQLKRFMWSDWKIGQDKDQRQKVKERYDDYPACWRYFCNSAPRYEFLCRGGRVIRNRGRKVA